MSGRIRIQIEELALTGATPHEARRLADQLVRELQRDPASLVSRRSRLKPEVSGGRIRASRRIELSGAALADVVRRALKS